MAAADHDHVKTGREIHHAPRACREREIWEPDSIGAKTLRLKAPEQKIARCGFQASIEIRERNFLNLFRAYVYVWC
ncbi:hypothetical protein D3C80_1983660 [compost metagenome]